MNSSHQICGANQKIVAQKAETRPSPFLNHFFKQSTTKTKQKQQQQQLQHILELTLGMRELKTSV